MADGPFSPGDPNSFSRPELAVIEHIDLFLDVNFESKTLSGEAHYVIGRKDPNVTNVIMDVYNLTILDIQEKNTKSTLSYNIGTHVDNFGSKLDITLPPKDKDHNRVELIIKYKTSPTSSALQWLEPEQTAGKTKPYMFSQCQPIHCRSMIPVQDTPSDEHKNYFYQPIKVPSYLVAIVVGNLASYKISERCSVWSEPELVKEAADEFNETEKFLSTAEEICGTYVWGVYDLVMLPPSFPFGGMENPCLTFVTPTLLLKTLGEDNPLTKLIVDLKHTHPDDAFSTCPYEKGHTFLFYLEQLLGGPKDFEPWLKKYLAEFALQSIDTDNFKAHLTSHFAHKPEIHQIEWDLWLNTTGMPPHIPKYDTSLQDVCNDLANRWISWNHTKETPFSKQDLAAFTPGQKIEFLAILLDKEMYDLPKVKSLQEVYRFNGVRNCEIRFRWLKLCLKARWKEQVPHVIDMVTSQGRMKYVRPLYRELYAWEDTRQTAIDTFKQHRKQMMYVTAYTLAKDLKLGDLDSAEKKAESKG
ncbi:hypothetical protein M8J76_008708 [Diaphorina citri]|nr:hypothetical protein M8J76_008708 [Diaphorina citri]